MRYVIEDEQLAKIDADERVRVKRFGPDLHRAFRKVIGLIRAARDLRELYAIRSLRL